MADQEDEDPEDWRELISRVTLFDDDAVEEFSDRIQAIAWRFFRAKGFTHEDAEDLTQDAVFRVISSRSLKEHYDRSRHFVPWLLGVLRYMAHDELRRRYKTVQAYSNQDYREPGKRISTGVRDAVPGESIEVTALREAFCQLSEVDQQIILGRLAEPPIRFRDLAEELGISSAAARKKHQRAMARLDDIVRVDERLAHLRSDTDEVAL